MVFSIGTKVRLKHTGDIGKITALLEHGIVTVLLDEDIEIPVSEYDLERYDDGKSSVKAKIVKGKQQKIELPPDRPPAQSQYFILKSKGIQLAFVPLEALDGIVSEYDICLINDTNYDVLYSFSIVFETTTVRTLNGRLESMSVLSLGTMLYAQLNEVPIIEIECWQVTTQGTGKRLFKELRLKPKSFFKSIRTAPFINKPVHLYLIFDNLNPTSEKTVPSENLETYTKRNARPIRRKSSHSQQDMHSVEAFAHFNPELDLHIEQLSKKRGMSNSEKLQIQLSNFDTFLDKAIHLGVPRVFVIHGIGKGRLKNEITTRLIQHPDIVTFKNEYHPRYGYGATEIILEEKYK